MVVGVDGLGGNVREAHSRVFLGCSRVMSVKHQVGASDKRFHIFPYPEEDSYIVDEHVQTSMFLRDGVPSGTYAVLAADVQLQQGRLQPLRLKFLPSLLPMLQATGWK